jgi:hypothetical protein
LDAGGLKGCELFTPQWAHRSPEINSPKELAIVDTAFSGFSSWSQKTIEGSPGVEKSKQK